MDENNNSGYDWQNSPPPQTNEWSAPQYQPYPPPQPRHSPQWEPPPKKNAAPWVLGIIGFVLVVGVAFLSVTLVRSVRAPGEGNNATSPAIVDDSRLELDYTPDADRSVASLDHEDALTPVEIHERLFRTNVAVQIHGARRDAVVGEGSGIIIHENSAGTHTYIVTCAHVIAGRQRVSVELYCGESFVAAIVGYDVRTDVGLLQIEATGLPSATFGDSSAIRVGEPVYAIGNPGGIHFMASFTSGVVSAIDRTITARHTMVTIQHTAPISPGNSGGALVNAMGQVIGINSQKIVDIQFEGMGFAVPSRTVQEVVNHLIATGFVPNRPKLGIQYLLATQTPPGNFVVRSNNLPSGSMIIARIDDDSDFIDTDVRVNDIITHVNGNAITRPEVLLQVIESGTVGQELTLSIARVGNDFAITTFDVRVRLVEDRSVFEPEEESTLPWFEEPFDPFGNPFR